MARDPWSKYAWLDEEPSDDLMAGCLGVVIGSDEETVRRHLAVKAGSRRDATLREAWQMSESDFGNDLVQVSSIGNAVVTFEPNGWHGVDAETAVPLSLNGRYVAFFWNVNAVMRFVVAEGGSITRDFDPLLYNGERERALPEESDLPFGSENVNRSAPRQASLALIERLTGVEVTRTWLLDEAHPTYRIDPELPSSSA